MDAVKEAEQVESAGRASHPAAAAEDQNKDGPKQTKSRSRPESLGLSRCAACYNHKAGPRWGGGDGESSSSAEDSGPEVEPESEAESSSSSSSSSSFSEEVSPSETLEKPPAEADGREEEDESGTNKTRGASFTPHLTPLSLLPRPPSVVSTLHLQVLLQKHDGSDGGGDYIIKQQPSDREKEKGVKHLKPFQMRQAGLPWQQWSQQTLQQQQLSHQQQQQQQQQQHQQHQQQQHQHFFPPSAQGRRLPPTPHTLPVPHPVTLYGPQTHLHAAAAAAAAATAAATAAAAAAAPPCWCCYSVHFPHTH